MKNVPISVPSRGMAMFMISSPNAAKFFMMTTADKIRLAASRKIKMTLELLSVKSQSFFIF